MPATICLTPSPDHPQPEGIRWDLNMEGVTLAIAVRLTEGSMGHAAIVHVSNWGGTPYARIIDPENGPDAHKPVARTAERGGPPATCLYSVCLAFKAISARDRPSQLK